MRKISYFLMSIGTVMYSLGILFRIQHWPGAMKGKIIGLAFVIIGVVIFLISLAQRQEKK